MPYRFLLDEHVPRSLEVAVRAWASEIEIAVVGEEPAPPKGTPDSALLSWIEEHNFLLITDDRSTMPTALDIHLGRGHHVPGILILPRPLQFRRAVENIGLIWGAALPDEYRDQIAFL